MAKKQDDTLCKRGAAKLTKAKNKQKIFTLAAVWELTSIHCNVFFSKVSYVWRVSSTVHNQKINFLLVRSGTTAIYIAVNTKVSMKSLGTFLI